MKEKYIVVLGKQGEVDNGHIQDYIDELKGLGYTPVVVYIRTDYFPTLTDEFGNPEPDLQKIYANHGISEYELTLEPTDPAYISPYKLVRSEIMSNFPHMDFSDIHVVLFREDSTAWAEIEIGYVFAAEIRPDGFAVGV